MLECRWVAALLTVNVVKSECGACVGDVSVSLHPCGDAIPNFPDNFAEALLVAAGAATWCAGDE